MTPRRTPLEQPPPSRGTTNEELVARVQNLEELLRGHVSMGSLSNVVVSGQQLTPITPATDATSYQSSADEPSNRPGTSSATTCFQPSLGVGRLSRTESGHVRYEPRASSWSSVLNDSSVAVPITNLDDASANEPYSYPFSRGPLTTVEDLLVALPPFQQCNKLKDVFFQVFSPLFHVLHDPTFDADYRRFQSNPESVSLSWLALLFVILSISVTALEDSSPLLHDLGRKSSSTENVAFLSSRYRAAAMQCLEADYYLWRHTMQTLQALILMIYGINHTHGQTWALLGMTYNIALALGCHVDPDNFGLDVVQCEERRRCWAGLMMLYTVQNSCMGNVDVHCIQQSVRLPANVNDDQLVGETVPPDSDGPTQMSYILFKFRLYNLCSKICENMFGPRQPSYRAIMILDQEIAREQEDWNARYLADSQSGPLPVHQVVHLNILYGYSHQLFLLLHRPAFTNASSCADPDEVRNSRNRCLDSARGLLGIHIMLEESPEFSPFRWYNQGLGSFHAFHAAVVLVVVLATADDSIQYHDTTQVLENSVRIFERMASRSRVCAKAAPVLRCLLSAAIDTRRDPLVAFSHTTQMDGLVDRLQPQQWLNPAAMSWNEWDFLLDNDTFQQPITA
ncbi:hypothetical protein LTR16_001043 [Cryomyces antarcticus]|uniref:Xylanolytic transcriptional activator regulatory domain-containing protein n=1 Tax=Cryomyces antarcticus TaxID=329879 RepID=A0ABR0M8S3_9PEZI|nr:hypothetical protein LTR39_000788 [Cryomyces antarcticus]KAK5020457.1 hypothetical protein LTR60_000498 [Cryomyces antarcticus]KAK5295345.1 hypothetical protein LTR16_001043 [Cryomyces antarcticus]